MAGHDFKEGNFMPPYTSLPFTISFSADNVNGKKTKSPAFQEVEAALDLYVRNSAKQNLLALTKSLGDWKLGKYNLKKKAHWTDSVRADAVRKLDLWLIGESKAIGIFPTSRSLWNKNHNCYAYSMKCKFPEGLGQNSWTGKFAKSKNKDGKCPESVIASEIFHFQNGVVADGEALKKRIVILKQELPTPVPIRLPGGYYLVAMVSNGMGYHFLRRRESTGLWTHKNGAASDVETHFYDRELEQPVAITNAVVAKMLTDPALIGCSMSFCCYFQVPGSGIQVMG